MKIVVHPAVEPDRLAPVVERERAGLLGAVAHVGDLAEADERAAQLRDDEPGEVARVDGEELAADLEREAVRARAGEDGRLRGVGGVGGGDFGEDAADDVGRAADEGVALRGDRLS